MQAIDDKKLLEILGRENYVAKEELDKAAAFVASHKTPLADYLLTAGLVTNDLLGQAIAESSGVSYADLDAKPPTHELLRRVPVSFAKQFRAIVFEEDREQVTLATDDPGNAKLAKEAKALFGKKKVEIAYALPASLDLVLASYRKPLNTRTIQIIKSGERVAPEIIDAIIEDALAYRASDVHMEPQEDEIVIRMRVDGVLQEAGRLQPEWYENILNRIKVQTKMRIDEHQSAQDGAMRYEKDGHVVDLRVSVAPTLNGEKVVMRLLTEYVRAFTLGNLGLSTEHQELIIKASKKPFGMVMTTGPTGSGKTTTLYALLKILNRPDINITTIEDPVEYKIAGVNQIQVNPQTNLTFAAGLKSIVRQDPDTILVGEIRDQETAEIAVNAALTGHLLLTTFHANDAATAIPRLLDMGIEPFLLASTLEVVIAQRLVRRICSNCRYSQTVLLKEIEQLVPAAGRFFSGKHATLYRGKGCDSCSGTGYKGRIAIFEFIEMTPEMQALVLENPSSQEVEQLARSQHFTSMFDDGLEKVKSGITTLEELVRVAEPPHPGTNYGSKRKR